MTFRRALHAAAIAAALPVGSPSIPRPTAGRVELDRAESGIPADGQERLPRARIDGVLGFPDGAEVASEELQRMVVWLNGKHPASGGWFLQEAAVSEEGRFVFESVMPGARCHFGLRHARFVLVDGPRVQLEPGEARTVELVLRRGVTVAGHVVDERGAAVEGCSVGLVEQTHGTYRGHLGGSRYVRTSADGRFRFEGWGAGEYELTAHTDGYIRAWRYLGALDLGEELLDLRLELEPRPVEELPPPRGAATPPGSTPSVGAESARAPTGWEVVASKPLEGAPAQPPGPARAAGWAWRVRDPRTGIVFLLVEPGRFLMGSPEAEPWRWPHEGPQREVELTRPFYLAATEVTQEQWTRVLGSNPSHVSGDDRRPVEQVTWDEARTFCDRLGYRLPTEAEWEYACRAGTTTPWSTGERLPYRSARVNREPRAPTAPVGSYPPNPWGFHDMHGNVSEWCRDAYDDEYHARSARVDPSSVDGLELRSVRGGHVSAPPGVARSAARGWGSPDAGAETVGLRPAVDLVR